jgi:sodium transport system permease protein
VLATTLNLTALGLSVGHLLGMLSESFGGGLGQVPLLALLSVAPLALLFSFFVSAILTGIASMAGTFKEGQALLGPVQILFIVPAMVGVIPGLELSLPLACVPVVNVVLAFRGLLLGVIQPAEYALTALSLLLYGLLAIRLAVLVLSREGSRLSRRSFSFGRLLGRAPGRMHGS